MKRMKLITLIIAATTFCLACDTNKGGLEKAGERADEIVDNVKDGDPILHKKGAAEKAGEAIDDTVKEVTGKK